MSKKKSQINGGTIEDKWLKKRLPVDIKFLLNNEFVTSVDFNNGQNIENTDVASNEKYKFIKSSAAPFVSVNYKGYNIKIEYPEDWPYANNIVSIKPPVPGSKPIEYSVFVIQNIDHLKIIEELGDKVQWKNHFPLDFEDCVNYMFKSIDENIKKAMPSAIWLVKNKGTEFISRRPNSNFVGGKKRNKTKKRRYSRHRIYASSISIIE